MAIDDAPAIHSAVDTPYASEDDPPTHLSYQAVARSQRASLAASQPGTRTALPSVQTQASASGARRTGKSVKGAKPPVPRHALNKPKRPAMPEHDAQDMVDIAAAPGRRGEKSLPTDDTSSAVWQQGQMIQGLQRELHALHGLMQNQLSVLELDAMVKRNPVQFDVLSRLSEMGLGADIARPLASSLASNDAEKAWRLALGRLANDIPIADDELLDTGGVVALVGPTGVGKTTSVAKLAARFVMHHGQRSVALISTDSYRIGAHEQLHNFARILGVPFKAANSPEELSLALSGFFDKKLVLIDTAGMSQRDMRLNEQFFTLRESFPVISSYLVIAANTQLGALDESFKGFGRVDLSRCIVTKLDETTSIGAVLTVAIRHKLPIAYVGVGQRVPEDLQPARAHRLISRAVPMAERYGEQIDQETLAIRYASGVAHAHV